MPIAVDPQMALGSPKIIHIIDELKVGGAQTHLVTMLREAMRTGTFDHRIVGLFDDGPIGDQIRELGIPVDVLDVRSHFAGRRFDRVYGDLLNLIRQYRPAIVEAHLTWSRLLALPAAWRADVPVRIGYEQGDIYLSSWKFRLANFATQIVADRIIVCSEALAAWNHRTNQFSRDRMAVFHNCVDIDRFDPASVDVTMLPFHRPDCRTLFCAVGTLGRGVNKRVDVAIRGVAAARSQGADVGLTIAGDGDQRSELEVLARELGVADQVSFLGMRSDIPAIMAASDAFCHAAPFEPFGIVCVEAMAMSRPVVVPDTGGMREAVEGGVTGQIYPALDHEALGHAMAQLDANPEEARAMGAAGRQRAATQFSVRGYLERLDTLYLELLAEKRS